jgi:hypothetical protein
MGITLPNGVTSIEPYTFYSCYNLTSITIPESITSIGYDAFIGCIKLIEVYNLSDISITAGSDRENGYVGSYAKDVYTDESAESKLINENGYIFYSDEELNVHYLIGYTGDDTTLVLPDDINGHKYEIYKHAFYEHSGIISITVPEGVTGIGEKAFNHCTSLASITISEGITSIGACVLGGCSNLTTLTIPDSITSIGKRTFDECDGLRSVTIPDSVTSIGDFAFSWCKKLETVYYTGTEEEWAAISIGRNNDYILNATIIYNYVPEE